MPVAAPEIRNTGWAPDDVRGQYSDASPHADLYRYLSRYSRMDLYLNVGYSEPGQTYLHPSTHIRLIERMGDLLMTLGEAAAGETTRLLDIGSGRGGAAIHACRRYGLEVSGVDFTPANVSLANANAAEQGVWPRVRFHEADALNLPFPDASFDLAWSIESPAHFADKHRFLCEAGRVLKPRGAIAFCDLLAVDGVISASDENRRIYAEFLEVWDVPYLETRGGYERGVETAGLRMVRSEVVTDRNLARCLEYSTLFLRVSRIRPLYAAHRWWVARSRGADLDNVYEHVLKSHNALKRGMIDYGLFWATKPG